VTNLLRAETLIVVADNRISSFLGAEHLVQVVQVGRARAVLVRVLRELLID
jgi:hypothetical protein